MRIGFLWVGRTRDGNIHAALERYIVRIRRYCRVSVTEVREARATDRHAEAEALLTEGRRIREAVTTGDRTVLLDAGGRTMSSQEFAGYIESMMGAGQKGLTFIIGGHQGVDAGTKKFADETISLSRMTFTHEMARLIAAEQVFRALSIIRGGRYHR